MPKIAIPEYFRVSVNQTLYSVKNQSTKLTFTPFFQLNWRANWSILRAQNQIPHCHQATVGGPQGANRLPLPAAVFGWFHPCRAGTPGFYVQDERYAAGAVMRRSGHSETRRPDSSAKAEPDALSRRVRAELQVPARGGASQVSG